MANENEKKPDTLRVEIVRKYWPSTATGDADALDVGTVIDLPKNEAISVVDSGVAKLVASA